MSHDELIELLKAAYAMVLDFELMQETFTPRSLQDAIESKNRLKRAYTRVTKPETQPGEACGESVCES